MVSSVAAVRGERMGFTSAPGSVLVGVSGAGGAPYALCLLQSWQAAGRTLQLSISDAPRDGGRP